MPLDTHFEEKLFLQDTLEKESREGIHKAMYSLLSWVLQQRRSIIRAFWSNLSKDYNLDSYPKLQKLITNLPSGTSHGATYAPIIICWLKSSESP